MKKSIALAAVCATALSPILSTAAYADTVPPVTAAAADDNTEAAMQDQCDALAASYDTGNGDVWSGEVVAGATNQVGATVETGTRDIDTSTIAHAGTYVPAVLEIRGDPFRTGGSVNMFGNQWSTAGYWTDSTYSFNADFASTFAHAFDCAISQEVFHAAYTEHVPADGAYVVFGDFGESEAAQRGNCAAFTSQGFPLETRPDWWGVEIYRGGNVDKNPHCKFEGTQAHDIDHEEKLDDPVLRFTIAGTPVEQDQTDELTAFEDHGGPVQVTGDFFVGKTVVCISPGSKGGAWRVQNGYTGTKCTTPWFIAAPILQGSTTSNGTYTSVPNYTL